MNKSFVNLPFLLVSPFNFWLAQLIERYICVGKHASLADEFTEKEKHMTKGSAHSDYDAVTVENNISLLKLRVLGSSLCSSAACVLETRRINRKLMT